MKNAALNLIAPLPEPAPEEPHYLSVLKRVGQGPRPSLGLALGGGGARGFAHVLIFEALDELGIKPGIISGTSIGSLMGAAYASGMSGRDIRDYSCELFQKRTQFARRFFGPKRSPVFRLGPMFFSGERVLEALLPETLPKTFAELEIPLLTVATDFYSQDQVVQSQGPLVRAIAASCALPGVLRPIRSDGRVLIDGGFVNPLPCDLLHGYVDVVAAVDITAGPQETLGKMPSLIETIIGSQQITLRSILRERMKTRCPDILIRPDVGRFRVLDFFKFEEVFAAAEPAKDEFKRACENALKSSMKNQAD